MNLEHLVEMAALVSVHASHFIEQPGRLPDRPLQDFWRHSRRRLSDWTYRLRPLAEARRVSGFEPAALDWARAEPVLDHIFVSDVLTRVWAAVLTAADRRRRTGHSEPIARYVFIGCLQARHLALQVMVNCVKIRTAEVQRINRLRRTMERWTDLLLGPLVYRYGLCDFAFDARRAQEFGADQAEAPSWGPGLSAWKLLLAGLKLAVPKGRQAEFQSGCEHDGVVQSIIAAFPADAFDRDGAWQSLFQVRLGRNGWHPERRCAERPPMPPIRSSPGRLGEHET